MWHIRWKKNDDDIINTYMNTKKNRKDSDIYLEFTIIFFFSMTNGYYYLMDFYPFGFTDVSLFAYRITFFFSLLFSIVIRKNRW
jgi:hypothetical protein